MSEETKTAEEIKNVPEAIHLMTSQHVENLNEDDELNFSDFSTEYVYWSEGESNDPYDTNYILKEKYDRQQSANAELKEKCSNLVELNSTMINQQFEYEKQIAELKKQNAELVEALDKLLQLALSNGCEYDCDNDCEFPEVERASELISKHTT